MKTKSNISKIKSYSTVTHVVVALALVANMGLVMFPLASVGATTQIEEFTENDTFTVPVGVTEITVEVWGSGGAGGGSTSAGGGSARGGAGGGGGAYASSILNVEPGSELWVIIETGGIGVTGDDGNPGSSSFVGPDINPGNALVLATGGSGGAGNTVGGDPVGGAGGTVEDSIGQIRVAGASGEDGATGKGCESGAGGEGAYGGGDGGAAVINGNEDGNPGNTPAGGGGGARTQGNGAPRIGGAGADGKVVISWVTYDMTISSTAGGSVTDPGEGAFTYGEGSVVGIAAEAEEGYGFVQWTGDIGTVADVFSASTTITMSDDCSVTASFEEFPLVKYDLTISSMEGGLVNTPGEGVFTYGQVSVVGLAAEADENYRFVKWTGDVGAIADIEAAVTTITMKGDYSITANFEVLPLSVTTKAATNVTDYSSTLNMDYNVGNVSSVEVRFAYKKSVDSAWSYTDWVSKSGSGTHAETLTGLSPNDNYNFMAQIKQNDIEIEGTTFQFTTETPSPAGGCFIATATYGTPAAEQIDVLRDFRDVVLLESIPGSLFVFLYYQFSPPVADFIAGNELLRSLVREFLIDPIVLFVEATGGVWRN